MAEVGDVCLGADGALDGSEKRRALCSGEGDEVEFLSWGLGC